MDLDRLVYDRLTGVDRGVLGHGRLASHVFADREATRHRARVLACDVGLARHLGELVADDRVVGEAGAERLACSGPADREVQAALGGRVRPAMMTPPHS